MSVFLQMEHVSKRFGDFYANKDISLTVNNGEVLTLLGENGAGKSTLMNILIGLYQPTEGKILINGREVKIDSPSQAVKNGIGMVHQHFMLVEAMTVFENIILGDKKSKGIFIDRVARKEEILELSERYGLNVELDALVKDISVGEQQRVEILKALYHGAKLLILDEPTAGLDPKGRDELFDEIIELKKKRDMTIILVSHSMEDVAKYVDRLLVMNKGELVLDGTPKEVFKQYKFLESIGLSAPGITYIVERLKKEGIDLGDDITTIEEAKDAILEYIKRKDKNA